MCSTLPTNIRSSSITTALSFASCEYLYKKHQMLLSHSAPWFMVTQCARTAAYRSSFSTPVRLRFCIRLSRTVPIHCLFSSPLAPNISNYTRYSILVTYSPGTLQVLVLFIFSYPIPYPRTCSVLKIARATSLLSFSVFVYVPLHSSHLIIHHYTCSIFPTPLLTWLNKRAVSLSIRPITSFSVLRTSY